MAITSELLGKIGKMDSEPIEGVNSGSSGSTKVIRTVEIPEGETWLISVVGNMNPASTSSTLIPALVVGNSASLVVGDVGLSSVETGQVDIGIKRQYSSREDSFVGELYTMKL